MRPAMKCRWRLEGGYPAGVKSADWYVNDKKGNKVVIQVIK